MLVTLILKDFEIKKRELGEVKSLLLVIPIVPPSLIRVVYGLDWRQ